MSAFNKAVEAIKSNNFNQFEELLDNNPTLLLESDQSDYTLLHYACAKLANDMIFILLRDGANLNAVALNDKTPFELFIFSNFSNKDGKKPFPEKKIEALKKILDYNPTIRFNLIQDFRKFEQHFPMTNKAYDQVINLLIGKAYEQHEGRPPKKRPNPRPKPKF